MAPPVRLPHQVCKGSTAYQGCRAAQKGTSAAAQRQRRRRRDWRRMRLGTIAPLPPAVAVDCTCQCPCCKPSLGRRRVQPDGPGQANELAVGAAAPATPTPALLPPFAAPGFGAGLAVPSMPGLPEWMSRSVGPATMPFAAPPPLPCFAPAPMPGFGAEQHPGQQQYAPGGGQLGQQYAQQQQQCLQQQGGQAAARPNGGGRKKALIVAVSYDGSSAPLRGPLNDGKCMRYLLQHKCGFSQDDILVLWEDVEERQRLPTAANILQGLRWLLSDLQPGYSLVFHYSGHGSVEANQRGGYNVKLLPLDFDTAGCIHDAELNRLLVNPLPPGVKLHCIVDACHSGSMLDLPQTAVVAGGHAEWERCVVPRPDKGTSGGFAVLFSACQDNQAASDTAAFSGVVSTGAATFCFIKALERRGLKLSYEQLLVEMNYSCKEELVKLYKARGEEGEPQEVTMSASWQFDLDAPFAL